MAQVESLRAKAEHSGGPQMPIETDAANARRRWLSTITNEYAIISGTANSDLAHAIAAALHITPAAASAAHFPDGETSVELLEPVRGKTVFIIQPTGPPVNDNLIELLAVADACRRASAAHVCAVIPYFGYARSDKRHGRREPIAASMVARLLQAVGVD